ncbi:MAG: hypothetical protein M3539_14135, partial [Acidobacteriota bacterium]|nr:hypothetical protein [Acidobacteriota bacterium]
MSERQKWTKKGLIFSPRSNSDWLHTHAALPIVDRIGNLHRVYFSSRDKNNRARIGYFEIDMNAIGSILRVSERPVIDLGPLGSFDDHGVSTSCIVNHQGKKYHYYVGWNLGVTVPFYFYVGLAISEDGGETYRKASPAPILGRNKIDPYLTASPSVLVEDGR